MWRFLALLGGAAAVISCTILPQQQSSPCINGLLLNTLCQHLSHAADLSSTAKADAFAAHWKAADDGIFMARETGLKIPQDIAQAYNSTLELARRHRYYGSSALRVAMRDSRPLTPAETRPTTP